MARFGCKCGETLSNSMAPNDVQLRVFTDREWDGIINLGDIDSIDLPDPKKDVWMCSKCKRIYVFNEEDTSKLLRVYAIEEEIK